MFFAISLRGPLVLRLWFLVRKDLLLLKRDPSALAMIVLIPLLLATLFGVVNSHAGRPSAMKIYVVDEDGSAQSATFIERLEKSGKLKITVAKRDTAMQGLRLARRTAALVILPDFGARLARFPLAANSAAVELHVDPRSGQGAGMLIGVAIQTALEVIEGRFAASSAGGQGAASLQPLEVITRPFEVQRALPANAFEITIPQAALWSILSAVAIMSGGLTAERSQQTLLRLKVSPTPPALILGARILSCVVTIIISVAVIMLVGVLCFGVTLSDPGLLLLAVICCGFCFAGLMLAIGSMGRDPGSVTGFAWGLMVIFALLGGGMIPQFLMPDWLKLIGGISPGKWVVLSIEGAIWRDFTLLEAALPLAVLIVVGALGTAIGVHRLRRSGSG